MQIGALTRFQSSVEVKDRISKSLRSTTPQSVRSYLALHWAIVASKRREIKVALRLGLEWLKAPWSVGILIRRKGAKESRRRIVAI